MARLDNPENLLNALALACKDRYSSDSQYPKLGSIFCPSCCDEVTVNVLLSHMRLTIGQAILAQMSGNVISGMSYGDTRAYSPTATAPSLFTYCCVNCPTKFHAVLFRRNQSMQLIVIPSSAGGLGTPATPAAIKYFVDQAFSAQTATALSAAICMYRAALEQILHDQGYTGKLPKKVNDLNEDFKNKTGKEWVRKVNPEALQIIKDVADTQAHAGDGTTELETGFMEAVQEVFRLLLAIIYEQPHTRDKNRTRLEQRLIEAKIHGKSEA